MFPIYLAVSIVSSDLILLFPTRIRMVSYRRYTKILSALVLICALIEPLSARPRVGLALSFQEMFDKADLVVIATVIKTKDTTERKKLIDIDIVETARPDLLQDEVIGVETEFETRLTLKGSKEVNKFLLHHYRPAGQNEGGYGAPNFVRIPSGYPGTFLMFLIKEKDGRYAPITGQFDPDGMSVFQIHDATSWMRNPPSEAK